MNAITEIRRIEADLYRFIQNASEPYKWIKAYLAPIGLFDKHVDRDDHDEVEGSLKDRDEEVETLREAIKEFEDIIQKIADALHQIGKPEFPGFAKTLNHIATVIEDGEHTVLCDGDAIFEAIEEIVAKESAATCLNSDTATISPEPQTEPQTTPPQHENTIVQTRRVLPGFSTGKRAA